MTDEARERALAAYNEGTLEGTNDWEDEAFRAGYDARVAEVEVLQSQVAELRAYIDRHLGDTERQETRLRIERRVADGSLDLSPPKTPPPSVPPPEHEEEIGRLREVIHSAKGLLESWRIGGRPLEGTHAWLDALSAAPPAEVPCEFGPECPACAEERGDNDPSRQRIDKLGLEIERGPHEHEGKACTMPCPAPPTELEPDLREEKFCARCGCDSFECTGATTGQCSRMTAPGAGQDGDTWKAAFLRCDKKRRERATELERLRAALGEIRGQITDRPAHINRPWTVLFAIDGILKGVGL